MDVTKSIKDAGYIAVGAGVIGFQQAQVRRREIGSAAVRHAGDARSCARAQLESFRSQVASQSTEIRTTVENQTAGARELASTGLAGVSTGLTETASGLTDAATGLADDVRDLVEPIVGEARVRVEPLVEQLQAVPEHVVRAVDAGRTKVLGLVGVGTSTPASAA